MNKRVVVSGNWQKIEELLQGDDGLVDFFFNDLI